MEFKQIQTRAQPEESLKQTIVAQTCHRSEEAMAVSFVALLKCVVVNGVKGIKLML